MEELLFFCGFPYIFITGWTEYYQNLFCVFLSEHETFAYADAVQICSNIWTAQYIWERAMMKDQVMNTFKLDSIEEDVQQNQEDIIDLR